MSESDVGGNLTSITPLSRIIVEWCPTDGLTGDENLSPMVILAVDV